MRKLLRNSWISVATSHAFVLVVGVSTGILAARLLLPEGRGTLAAVLLWPQIIFGLGILGLNESLIYRLGNKEVDRDKAISTALYASLLLSGVLILIGWVLLPHLLGEQRLVWLDITRGYLVFFVIFSFLGRILIAVDQSELKFIRYSIFRLLVPAVYLIGLLLFWATGGLTVTEAIYANLAGVVLVYAIRAAMSPEMFGRMPSIEELRILLSRGIKFHVVAALFMLGSQIDKIVLILQWDDYSVGLYVVAITIASSGLGLVANVFHTIMYPNIVKADDRSTQMVYLAQGLRFAMLLLFTGSIALMLISPWLVPFLFGEAFEGSVVSTVVLLCAHIPLMMRNIIVRSLRGLGLSRPSAIAEVTSLLVFIAIFSPLGTMIGLPGIAFAMLLANLVSIAYLTVYLKRNLNLGLHEWWGLNLSTLNEFSVKLIGLLKANLR